MRRLTGEHVTIPSRSLKLLPILGVPSLSRDGSLPLPLGMRPDSSAVRRGDKGPKALFRSKGAFWEAGPGEPADESEC